MEKIKVGILGPGNIGTDLMFKILKSDILELDLMAGIVASEGIARATGLGVKTSTAGIEAIINNKALKIVFDATNASSHIKNASALKEAGKLAIDLTPAAVGPYVVPCVNINKIKNEDNLNMVTCGGQATVPIAYAIDRVADAEYVEIVSCISSKSAGPGTRSNIDEFTETTAKALKQFTKAESTKAIIVLNPAEPPIMMTNTIYVRIRNKAVKLKEITQSVDDIVTQIQEYVPGYLLRVPPIMDEDRVTVIIQVSGAGDFLPAYAGNLDIINAAAIQTAVKICSLRQL